MSVPGGHGTETSVISLTGKALKAARPCQMKPAAASHASPAGCIWHGRDRLAGVTLGLALAALLAGCPSGGGSSGGSAKHAGGEPLADGMVVKVGVVLELTGKDATFGEETRNGLEMALEDLKGKDPWSIKLVTRDNKCDPQESEHAAQELIEVEGVRAIIGAVASSNTKKAAKICQESEIPLSSPGSTADSITMHEEGGKLVRSEYISRVCFTDSFQGEVCAQFGAKELGKKRAAILIDQASDYARGLAKSFRETWARAGGEVATEQSYIAKESDFSAVIRKVADAKPEVIFIPGYYSDVGPMLKQALDLWKGIPKLGGDGWDSPDLFSLAGPDALADCYISSHYAPDDQTPIVKEFVARYKKRYNKDPGSMCVLGYDAGLVIHDAIKRANTTDPRKIKDAINGTKDFPGVTGTISLDANGNPHKDAVVLRIENGHYTFRARVKPSAP